MTNTISPPLLALISTLNSPVDRLSSLIRLQPDQLLHGRVVAVDGSQVVISLLGEQIAAESALSLMVGQTVTLVVREVRSDRVVLQVASETGAEESIRRPITDQDLSDLLTATHLLPDSTNLQIARALLRNSLPITSTIVSAARNALSFLHIPTADDVDAAIQLLAKGLPVTPQSLELAKCALLQPSDLGARVQALAAQLLELLLQTAETKRGEAAAMLPRHIPALAHQLLRELPLLIPDHVHGQAFAALVRQVLDQIATPTEHRLAQLLEEGEPEGFLPEDPRQALGVLIRQHPPEAMRDFRRQLASMNDAVAQASAELPTHHPLAPLLRELDVAIREMILMVEAEQLSNAGLPPPTQPQGYYVFNLPIVAAGQDAADTAEVRIYYQQRDHTKRIDPENAHLAFLLEMSHLGPIDVHVDLYQKRLRCRIECAHQEAIDLFRQSSSELQERLQDVGYTVDSVQTVMAVRSRERSDRESVPPLSKIDIRA